MSTEVIKLVRATEEDVPGILEYLSSDIPNCLYLYLDIYTYGVKDPNIIVWFGKDGDKIALVVMNYHGGFQIYSDRKDLDLTPVIEKIDEYDIDRFYARKDIIERLEPRYSDRYFSEYGKIVELKKYRVMKGIERVEEATKEDIPEIVDLLLTDDMRKATYSKEDLEEQMIDRVRTGMGASYIIREDGKIVAHLGIAAQTDKFRVAALTMVHTEYRNTLYGTLVDSYLINVLGKDGKRAFSFMTDERRIKMFLMMGDEVAAEYGKLIKRK